MKIPFLYPCNIFSIPKVFITLVNPLLFICYLIYPWRNCFIKVRTPIGRVNIFLRNRQSARTLYSIFIREDYLVSNCERQILDLGSNIGISALYFLSRNSKNRIYCVEPDPENRSFLKKNLFKFSDRSTLDFRAINLKDNDFLEFNLSKDGKYSSFNPIGERLLEKIKVETVSLKKIMKNTNFKGFIPILIKMDIEGLEKKIIKNFDFSSNINIKKLIVESTGLKNYINRKGKHKVKNGYVEHVSFN